MAASQLEELENSISAVLRILNERRSLCRDLADKQQARGNLMAAEQWRRAAEEAEGREKVAKGLVRLDWLHPEAVAEAGE